MTGDENNPLRPVCSAWIEKIRQAEEIKRRRFGADAAEGMQFFAGPYNWLYAPAREREHRHLIPPDGAKRATGGSQSRTEPGSAAASSWAM